MIIKYFYFCYCFLWKNKFKNTTTITTKICNKLLNAFSYSVFFFFTWKRTCHNTYLHLLRVKQSTTITVAAAAVAAATVSNFRPLFICSNESNYALYDVFIKCNFRKFCVNYFAPNSQFSNIQKDFTVYTPNRCLNEWIH